MSLCSWALLVNRCDSSHSRLPVACQGNRSSAGPGRYGAGRGPGQGGQPSSRRTSTVLPLAACRMSPGRMPLPSIMFSHAALMMCTCGAAARSAPSPEALRPAPAKPSLAPHPVCPAHRSRQTVNDPRAELQRHGRSAHPRMGCSPACSASTDGLLSSLQCRHTQP
jgi:hypothetical protein